ncbi:hypothetical protein IMSHALPRED_006146 [Imshaugia aleurites]|uniref:DUF7907 domain-containing protein n=1 Tax=Imshaugia aleurites TaxID=172621 RepID=A0A8H3FNK6_9LECA|nr:hypothetical protein IMSHALPRED_006146 [Imshaugia aleurites]
MHITLSALLSLAHLSLTLAATTSNAISSIANATLTPPIRYYLKTSVIDDDDSDKNDLYVTSWHTGAGFGDATLRPFSTLNKTVGFLNDTRQQFDLYTSITYGMIMAPSDNLEHVAWNFVRINDLASNAGDGSMSGFFFNASGLQWEGEGVWMSAGWLACDWWHGVPQLFWVFSRHLTSIPSSCAIVELLPFAV